uniref:Uncharacterized protein n=1 Tax=Daphnia magna TaxID=35525 RepID=A0A0N8B6C9_9CRUS
MAIMGMTTIRGILPDSVSPKIPLSNEKSSSGLARNVISSSANSFPTFSSGITKCGPSCSEALIVAALWSDWNTKVMEGVILFLRDSLEIVGRGSPLAKSAISNKDMDTVLNIFLELVG